MKHKYIVAMGVAILCMIFIALCVLLAQPAAATWTSRQQEIHAIADRLRLAWVMDDDSQRGISFRGGLETDLIDYHFVSNITSLRIAELWLACDTDAQLPRFKKACKKLTDAGFNRNQIRCYSLIGHDMEAEEQRNREIFRAGAMPFSQLERDFSRTKTEYSAEWNAFERQWQRPAASVAHMREVDAGMEQMMIEGEEHGKLGMDAHDRLQWDKKESCG